MPSILQRLRQKIIDRDYYLSSHAEEEMRDDELERPDLENAILKGTILRGADLRDVVNLTSEQLADALIDESTILPSYLRRQPAAKQ